MTFLPDTNVCITLLRRRNLRLAERWQATKASDVVLCSIVVYELRHGAERSSNPVREHGKLDMFSSRSFRCRSMMIARGNAR